MDIFEEIEKLREERDEAVKALREVKVNYESCYDIYDSTRKLVELVLSKHKE